MMTWDETHFREMSWHDNHVHALRNREGTHGCGELELDLDYIVEWLWTPEIRRQPQLLREEYSNMLAIAPVGIL